MQTLKSLGEQLKTQLDTNLTQHITQDISNKTFTKGTFQFLNKNVNFIPRAGIFDKNQSHRELEGFFSLTKLKA